MKPLFLLSLFLLAACRADRSAERYGFVTTLGRDTIAVERVTRRGDTLSIDGVDRFPYVRHRHTDVVLAGDRSIRRLTMSIHTPAARLARERDRLVTADFGRDTLVVTVRDSGGTNAKRIGTDGALMLPHVPQMYSLAELYIDAALARGKAAGIHAGDSVTVTQFYPDFALDRFRIHDGWVMPLHGDTVEIWHGMISGVGFAMLDSSGRLTAYSGAQSTYKVDVKRVTALPDVQAIGAWFDAAERKSGASQLSVRDTTRATIGRAQFTVDYGRPLARGRKLLGDVIELEAVWRTGANAATQFSTSAPITLAGLPLAAGKYTLWTVPHATGAELIVNRETGQWGTEYDPSKDLGRAPLAVATVADTVEKFAISITGTDPSHGTLQMSWGTFRWSAPIVVR
ncbi:MAG: DUF2911 domain-containing protein [Gemmatimonadales bacterium]